eukprot:6235800-Amphidinium_carterae.3
MVRVYRLQIKYFFGGSLCVTRSLQDGVLQHELRELLKERTAQEELAEAWTRSLETQILTTT